MANLNVILSKLPAPRWQRENIIKYHAVQDIVSGTLDMHRKSLPEYDAISEEFWKGDTVRTAENIFKFLKKHVPYKAEPSKDQTGKHPAVILLDGLNGHSNDCKHYALFINGVLDSLRRKGYPVEPVYVFASDKRNVNEPTHVFAAIKDGNGGLIWVDPVLDYFNQPYEYYYFKVKKIPMYSHVSGIGSVGDNYLGWLDAGVGAHGKGRAKFKKFVKKIQPGKLLVTASMAPSRHSFLLLLKLNAFNMAHKMFQLGQTPHGKSVLQKIWKKVGGQWPALANNINAGYKHYLKMHHRKMPQQYHMLSGNQINDLNYMVVSGVEPMGVGAVQLAAVIAAATPILTAFGALLKQLKAHPGEQVMSESINRTVTANNDGTLTDVSTQVTTGAPGKPQRMHFQDVQQNHLDRGFTPGRGELMTPMEAGGQVEQEVEQEVVNAPGIPARQAQLLKQEVAASQARKEIPFASSPVETAVNVGADFFSGARDFINENKNWIMPVAMLGGAVFLVRAVTGHGGGRRK